jgi:hypothetical protein
MITMQELGEKIQKKQQLKSEFNFNADKYKINIKFNDKDYVYIYVVIENLTSYGRIDKIARLTHYVRLNTNVLGYVCSTLAYTKNSDVIVHQWLNKNITTQSLLLAIDYLLQHADVLTDTHY